MPELMYPDGTLKLRPKQVALLQGLLDRPGATARSKVDAIGASQPYCIRYEGQRAAFWTMYHILYRLWKLRWIEFAESGHRIAVWITPRGRAVVSGEVPGRFVGGGPYVPGAWRKQASADQ